MSIDIQNEELIPFPDAPSHIPGRPHIATVHRWRLSGARGVKLDSILVGGKRFTSIEAIERFIERTTAAADGEGVPRAESSKTREKRLAKVEAELTAAGI